MCGLKVPGGGWVMSGWWVDGWVVETNFSVKPWPTLNNSFDFPDHFSGNFIRVGHRNEIPITNQWVITDKFHDSGL